MARLVAPTNGPPRAQLPASSCRLEDMRNRGCFETGCFETGIEGSAKRRNSAETSANLSLIQRNLAGTKSAHGGAVFASPLALVFALLALLLGGCLTEGALPADDEAGALSEAASLLGPETGAEVADVDGDPETAIYAETEASVDTDPETLDSAIAEASDDAVAETEAALSLACLDGVRDPVGEECDLAGHSARSLCSSTCASRDVLILPATSVDAGVPLGKRSLGLGRHTVAADPTGLAPLRRRRRVDDRRSPRLRARAGERLPGLAGAAEDRDARRHGRARALAR